MPYKNIKPDLWGPHLWRFLHYLSLSYPSNPTDEEKEIMLNFLESLQEILPCEKCRYNFNKHLDNLDMNALNNNENFIKWLFNVHNDVNKSNNKPIMEYDDFVKLYSTNQNQINNTTQQIIEQPPKQEILIKKNNKYYYAIMILIILILIVLVIRYC